MTESLDSTVGKLAHDKDFPRRCQVGDLIVDFDAHRVTRDNSAVSLTRKSFALFGALIRKSPHVLTHDELLHEAWGNIVVSDDALKQRIRVLRQSLDDQSDAPKYIESVRGIGYRLAAPVLVLDNADELGGGTHVRSRYVAAAAVAVVALVLLFIIGRDDDSTVSQSTVHQQAPIRLAVLPFRDLSESPGNAWFAAGITEDIITQLSNINDLLVLSRTTTSLYADSSKSLVEIANELEVSLVLEGSVRLDGERVRITGQLIDAQADTHVWAREYDQELEDIFAIQRDVASRIGQALRLEVSGLEASGYSEPPTESLEAYEYFLRGREAYQRYRRRDNETAIELYHEALRLDPNFTLARAELANAYALRVSNYQFDPSAAEPAKELAVAALDEDPQLPEAHKALGLILAAEGRLAEAHEAYVRAATLRPGYQAAVHNVAVVSRVLGRLDESLEWAQRAVVLDPASQPSAEMYGLALLELGFMDEADRWFNAVARREPLANRVQLYRMTTALLGDDIDAGKQATDRLMTAAPGCALCLSRAAIVESLAGNDTSAFAMFQDLFELSSVYKAYALLQMGRIRLEVALVNEDAALHDEAHEYLERAERIAQRAIAAGHENPVFPWYLAGVHAVRGEIDESLDWFERAVDAGRQDFAWDLMEPAMYNVRSHPRFTSLVELMRLQVAAMRDRARSEGWHAAEPPAFP